MGAVDAPANVSWKTILSTDSDKGEKMLVSGTVFQPDGKTPAPNVLISTMVPAPSFCRTRRNV
jgi:protocatechuate 3,4-dioxygenase beta subunit